jgi:hypothetical protein
LILRKFTLRHCARKDKLVDSEKAVILVITLNYNDSKIVFHLKINVFGALHRADRSLTCLGRKLTGEIMEQLKNRADDRLVNGCVYCGGLEETRDHVPSRVLLDSPLPENLPVVAACFSCNNSFSKDEEYLACLVEAVIAGSTEPDCIKRDGIANILRRSPALRARIEAAKISDGGQIQFNVEPDRILNVVLKLARGHAAYELSLPCRYTPSNYWWRPLNRMTDEELDSFDSSHVVDLIGEVGSRNTQRLFITPVNVMSPSGEEKTLNLLINEWIEVQEGRYRYLAIQDYNEVRIKMVIGEYLACEVTWQQ